MIAVILLGTALAASVAALSLVSWKLYIKVTTGMCHSQVCLVGKTAIVTGANTGIGYETALDFAKRGARVILACRDETKAKEAYNKIITATNNSNVVYKLVDLTSFDSVRRFAHDINANEDRLDILVNNAGAGRLGNKTTVDDLMKKHPSRIVNVSAIGAKLGSIDFTKLTSFTNESNQYITSKLCQILFTIELASRFKNTNITAYSLHPGVIKTEIFRHISPVFRWMILFLIDTFFKTAAEGAQTQIYCAVENGLEKYSGQHFHDCKMVPRYRSANDPALAKKLWEESERICKVNGLL